MIRTAAIASFFALAGCGAFEPLPAGDGGPSGPTCYDDSDCAPNGCCGMGTAVVHKSMAPNCAGMQCTSGDAGSCPVNGIRCGCGIPVCRANRCSSAISTRPEC